MASIRVGYNPESCPTRKGHTATQLWKRQNPQIKKKSNLGAHNSRATNLCTAASNAPGSLVWNFLYITLQRPEFWGGAYTFLKFVPSVLTYISTWQS